MNDEIAAEIRDELKNLRTTLEMLVDTIRST
jgi:hypothetical protein